MYACRSLRTNHISASAKHGQCQRWWCAGTINADRDKVLPASCTASLSACISSCQRCARRAIGIECYLELPDCPAYAGFCRLCCAMLLLGPQVMERRLGVCVQMALRVLMQVPIVQLQRWPEHHAVRGRCKGSFRLLTDAPAGVCWRLRAASVAAGSVFRAAVGCRSYPGRRCCGAADGFLALSKDFKVQSLAASPAARAAGCQTAN